MVGASDGPSFILGLPKIENAVAVGVLVIVGDGEDPSPAAAIAGVRSHGPSAGVLEPAIAKRDAESDAGKVRLLARGRVWTA
jgi:hypothetical protein